MRVVSNKVFGSAILHTVIANTIVTGSNTASVGALLWSDLAVGTTNQRSFANQVAEVGNTTIALANTNTKGTSNTDGITAGMYLYWSNNAALPIGSQVVSVPNSTHLVMSSAPTANANAVLMVFSSDPSVGAIKGATITKVWHGGPSTAYWTVKRQSHTDANANAIVGVFSGTGFVDFGADGMPLDMYPGYDIILTPVGTGAANSYLMLEMKKVTGVPQTPA